MNSEKLNNLFIFYDVTYVIWFSMDGESNDANIELIF